MPLLIVHAENDWDIPHAHSQTLFDAFLEKHMPPLPLAEAEDATIGPLNANELSERVAQVSQERLALRHELVAARDVPRLGRVEVFAKDRAHGPVAFFRTRWGGHATLGLVEGVQDYMAEMFGL